MSLDPIDLVAAALLAMVLLASIVVPLAFEAGRRGRMSAAMRQRVEVVTYAAAAVGAVVLLGGSLGIPLFLAAVTLYIAFGKEENVPFSRFPMFSRPAPVQWYIRVEDQDGQPMSGPKYFGIPTASIMKRFNTEMKAGAPHTSIHKATHSDRSAAGERLADFMMGLLHKRPRRAKAITTMRLLYIEVIQGPDGFDITPELLVERSP